MQIQFGSYVLKARKTVGRRETDVVASLAVPMLPQKLSLDSHASNTRYQIEQDQNGDTVTLTDAKTHHKLITAEAHYEYENLKLTMIVDDEALAAHPLRMGPEAKPMGAREVMPLLVGYLLGSGISFEDIETETHPGMNIEATRRHLNAHA